MEVTLGWMLNNKIIVILSLLSFALFVSTLALAGRKNTLYTELEECRRQQITTAAPVDAATTPATTPAPNPAPGTDQKDAPGETSGPHSKLLQLLAGSS